MIDTTGLSLAALERRVERAISDYLAVSRAGAVYAHPSARDQAESDAWDRLMEARAELDARSGVNAEEEAASQR